MSSFEKAEWLTIYHEGDPRLRKKRQGILQLNREKKRIEFAVQTTDKDHSPIIIVNYPIEYLRDVSVIERRKKLTKQKYLKLTFGEGENKMIPLFSFSFNDLDEVKNEVLKFKNDYQYSNSPKNEIYEPDIIKIFSQLLMTPIEQFQNFLSEFTSRLKQITSSTQISKTILSSLEPKYAYEIQEIEINGKKFRFFCTSYKHPTIVIILSLIGGRIEDYFPLIPVLLGNYQVFILGARGFDGLDEENNEYSFNDYVEDLKAFINYLGPDKRIIIAVHSLFSAIVLEEFLDERYPTVKKLILISGLHRAPDTFRIGVKSLPPPKSWSLFKSQVRKIAPKLLFKGSTNQKLVNSYIQHAFSLSDNIYYQLFKNFLPRYDYSKKLQTLKKPVLVIWGENDKIISSKLKEEMKNLNSSSLLSFKEITGGHMVILEEPDNVGREINLFISFSKRSQIKIE